MYFDYLTLAGLCSAVSVAGILYGMVSEKISGKRVSVQGRRLPCRTG